jgi:hypothetical protein
MWFCLSASFSPWVSVPGAEPNTSRGRFPKSLFLYRRSNSRECYGIRALQSHRRSIRARFRDSTAHRALNSRPARMRLIFSRGLSP